METVAPKWKKVAAAIGFNEARISAIDKGEHFKPEGATFEMFSRWLKGEHSLKPVTWDTLIKSLKQANLKEIAVMLCNVQIVSYSQMYTCITSLKLIYYRLKRMQAL